MGYQFLAVRQEGPVEHVTLNRPEVRNAFNERVIAELSDWAQNAAEDEDATKVTKVDADGNEYRECPQCGSNMYRQGRTWTCENCGYSYVE